MVLQLSITVFDGKRKKGHALYMSRKAVPQGQDRDKAVRFMLAEAREMFAEKITTPIFPDVEA